MNIFYHGIELALIAMRDLPQVQSSKRISDILVGDEV